jgi:hypothetical protein
VPQDSLLWGQGGKKTDPRWLKALWVKVLGPFEWRHFQEKRYFWLFWFGEKCQAAGFLWELLRETWATGIAIPLAASRHPDPHRMEHKS